VFLSELIILPWTFRFENSQRYRSRPDENGHSGSGKQYSILNYQATWICAAYLLLYVGTETAISGWIVSYMRRVRQTPVHFADLCASAFWGGMAIGRFSLGTITDRIGTRKGTILYLTCGILLQCAFVLVEVPIVAAGLITVIGFFCGPLFPSCIVQLATMIPKELHVSAVSFVASLGQVGGAFLPFGIGALSQWLGLRVFGVIIAVQLVICLVVWLVFTYSKSGTDVATLQDSEQDREQ
jgi:fucose permease